MPTVRLDIAYDGGRLSGWAAQPGLRTVQAELEAALETALRRPADLTVAGRTDAGVHAWAQVTSFELDGELPGDLARSLNGILDDDIVVLSATAAPAGFDARRDARSRTYCYRVLARAVRSPFERGRALWWPYQLDRDLLAECAALLPGEHDFTAFTPTETEHVRFERRILAAAWSEEVGSTGILRFEISADSFMRRMVRILVGTMLEVAGGRRTFDSFAGLLEGAERAEAGTTAAPHGLYLAAVSY